eukprot:5097292-Pyramimonas_sp.AAC.1
MAEARCRCCSPLLLPKKSKGDCLCLRAAPCDRKAVGGGRRAAELVQNDQASGGGRAEDVAHFDHLRAERGRARLQVVRGAHAGEEAVDGRKARPLRRHVASDVREDGVHRHRAEVGALAGHVGT